MFTVTNSPTANAQTLTVPTTGVLEFTPSTTDVFGFYSRWPFFGNRHLYSEDALNTFNGAIPHHVRVYPHPSENNAYIIATEEHISGFDFQDIVVIVRNVKPFVPSTPALSFNPTDLNFSANIGGNPDAQNATLTSNITLDVANVTLTASQPWVILPTKSLGTPMAFDVNTNGLAVGNYTATVTATADGFTQSLLNINLAITNEPVFTTRINFQDNTFTPPTGYIADIGLAYGDRGNGNFFGWTNGTGTPTSNEASARGTQRGVTNASSDSVKLKNSLSLMQGVASPANAKWEIAVPNGTYIVFVSAGDPDFINSQHTLRVEGEVAISNFVPTNQNLWKTAQVSVEVTDGKLTLDAIGGDNSKINYILIAPFDPDNLPPTLTTVFTGVENTPNVYRGSVSATLSAVDNAGANVTNIEYSLDNGANYQAYTTPISFTQAGLYNLLVRATDSEGRIRTEIYNFTIEPATGATIVLENMTKFPGTQNGFPADDFFVFHKNQEASLTSTLWHKSNVMRVRNTGVNPLIITQANISNATRFVITKINNIAFTPAAFPLTINAGAFADVEIEFVETSNANKVIRTESITLISNADNSVATSATLKASLMQAPEGGNEINSQQVMQVFGFTTTMNGQPSPSSDYPLPADVDAGVHGDLIVSTEFAQADNTKPIRALQLAALKGSGAETTQLVNAAGTVLGGFSYSYGGNWHQSLLPKTNNTPTNTVIAGDEVATLAGNFRIKSAVSTTAGQGGTNASTGLPNLLGIRVYIAKDRDGKVIPFSYIVIQDYIGSGCGAGSANCDWNDNVHYFTNIRPSAVPTATAIANQSATVGTLFSFNASTSFNKGYPGNKLTYEANLSSVNPLPAWLSINPQTGEISGTPPFNSPTSMLITITATDLNGLTVSQSFTLTITGTGNSLAAVDNEHLEFANTLVGSTNTLTLNVLNNALAGNPNLTINSVQIIGANAGEFNASITNNTAAPQGNAIITLNFAPQSIGLKQAKLLLSNSFTALPLEIPLYGIAVDQCITVQLEKRIKSGVNEDAVVNGVTWENDQAYRAGNVKLDVPNVTSIAQTSNDEVYIKYLSSNANLDVIQYNVPVSGAGNYFVRLHFVENAFSAANQRVFSGEIEGQTVFTNLDIFATVGKNTALVRDFSVTVLDNSLNIKFTPTVNRLALAGVEIFKSIPVPNSLAFNTPVLSNPSCNQADGSIQVSVSNATNQVTYTLGTVSNTTGLFTGLAAGNYNITAQEQGGCIILATYALNNSNNIEFELSANQVGCFSDNDATATISNIVGGDGNYTVTWNTTPVQNGLTATNLAVGIYTATILDGSGCPKTKSIEITKQSGCPATVRINAGGTTQTVAGTTWTGCTAGNCNNYVTGGGAYTQPNNPTITQIPSGMNQTIFQTEWTGGQSGGTPVPVGQVAFSYNIPVVNGNYLIRLYFTELNKNGVGLRVFDVNIEGGAKELVNYDIFKEVGYRVATSKEFTFNITDGVINIDFIRQVENAKISAIEIIPQAPVVDTQAPTAPVLSLGIVTQTIVGLTWTASTDNVGVTAYEVFNGADLAGSTSDLNFTVNGLTANTAYSFTVKAKDAAGNSSLASNTVNTTTLPVPDTEA
ncbi:MAG: hypothetical protein HC912_00075, partial [Saprospiraceae bacterium]|nr:hypothetical protein [Saprospiraceae bacterium]